MITLFVEKENIKNNLISVNKVSDINHVKNVFRKNEGDRIRVVDGEKEYISEIKKINSEEILLEIKFENTVNFSNNIDIEAGICLLKNDKMDMTIQKLTELGIKRIIPITARRTIAKIVKKKEKWDIIVRETLKQCQGIRPTEITEVKRLKEIDYTLYDLIIVPYECEEELSLKNLFNNLNKKPEKILYIIGSEGGFEKEEIEFLKSKNANIISLGKRILRAETAAIVTGGVLINEFQ